MTFILHQSADTSKIKNTTKRGSKVLSQATWGIWDHCSCYPQPDINETMDMALLVHHVGSLPVHSS